MEDTDNLSDLARTVHDLEYQGVTLTADWYHEAPMHLNEIGKLADVTTSSIHYLRQLSNNLNKRLAQATEDNRQPIQYAYNLVAELIQSREASREMLNTMSDDEKQQFREYFRALSLKEKAALSQADKLVKTVEKLH